ncbi:MAG: polyphosphate kinase 2 [Acidocella sp.]|nr:polyphosphate kinase 2 [Acidocella sp.]
MTIIRNPAEDQMAKHPKPAKPAKKYAVSLHDLQVELVKLQRHVISRGEKVLIILEGRDGAGKDGTIKRIIEHLSPRDIRVVALPKPSNREETQWYFQRYVAHLPAAGEIVIFNRSWYNRAGVEHVMGFCSQEEYDEFLRNVPVFEHMLAQAGIKLLKYYLDIERKEQKNRLEDRHEDPLKQWKISPIDEKALKHWDDYTKARDVMLRLTDSADAPWTVVVANDKKAARLAIIHDLITRVDYKDSKTDLPAHDHRIIARFDETCLTNGMLAK